MNLYRLHTNPEELKGYDQDIETILGLVAVKEYETDTSEFAEGNLVDKLVDIGRKKKVENAILKLKKSVKIYVMMDYAERVIKGRWPEAEKYIKKSEYDWNDYKLEWGID